VTGFEPEATHYKLRFADAAMEGLEVTAESLSVDGFLSVSALASAAQDTTGAAAAKSAGDLLDVFAQNLVAWNVTRKGHPVPATRAGVGTQKFDFILKIVMAWMEAIASVDSPLPGGSPSGATSPEAALPMEPLSANHRSSLVPS
jgi:hypothetical protein